MENSFAFGLNAEHSRAANYDDCITIDAGKDENGLVKNTLVHIQKTVAKPLENSEALMSITKLYVVGDFILDLDITEDRHGKGQEEASDPWTFLSIVKSLDSMAGASLTLQKLSPVTPEEYEWARAVEYIDKTIRRMGNLELT